MFPKIEVIRKHVEVFKTLLAGDVGLVPFLRKRETGNFHYFLGNIYSVRRANRYNMHKLLKRTLSTRKRKPKKLICGIHFFLNVNVYHTINFFYEDTYLRRPLNDTNCKLLYIAEFTGSPNSSFPVLSVYCQSPPGQKFCSNTTGSNKSGKADKC